MAHRSAHRPSRGGNKPAGTAPTTTARLVEIILGLALIASAFDNVPVKVSGLVSIQMSAPGALAAQIIFGVVGTALTLDGLNELLGQPCRHVHDGWRALRASIYGRLSRRSTMPMASGADKSPLLNADISAVQVVERTLAMRTKIVTRPDGTRTETREYFTEELALQQIRHDWQVAAHLPIEPVDE